MTMLPFTLTIQYSGGRLLRPFMNVHPHKFNLGAIQVCMLSFWTEELPEYKISATTCSSSFFYKILIFMTKSQNIVF